MHRSITTALAGAGLSGLFAVAPISLPALGASFDCAKATTSFEKAICADTALSAKDEVLAVAYATATGGLSAEAGSAMRGGQREWLAYVERACTPDGEPLREPYDADGIACLVSEFDQRIAGLEASRMLGGHRFYLVERFLALPRQGDEDWNKVATKSFSAVHLDGGPQAKGFNAFVEAESKPMLSDFSPPAPDAEGAEQVYTTDIANRIAVDAVSERMINLEVTSSWFGHGAAHGNYAITYLHYVLDPGRPLAVADIFPDAGYAAPFAEKVLAGLKAQFPGEGLWDDAAQAVENAVADPSRWSFSEEGVTVHFQPYEVTAYAAGAPKTLVPWHELADWLAPDAEALAVY